MITKVIKLVWITAAIIVLVLTLAGFDDKAGSDIAVLSTWYMLALSFPAGLLVQLVHVALYDGLSITVETSYSSLVLDWLGFFIVGYWQWFKLTPYLYRKLQKFRRVNSK